MCGVILGLFTPLGALKALESGKKGPEAQTQHQTSDSQMTSYKGQKNTEDQTAFNKCEEILKTDYHIHMLITTSS